MSEKKKKETLLSFKDRPLVRSGDSLYFGDPAMRFVVKLDILNKTAFANSKIPSQISVELLDTEDAKNPKLIMKSERESLYAALDIGSIWIDRATAESA